MSEMAGQSPNDPLYISDVGAPPPNYYREFLVNLDAIAQSTAMLTALIPSEFKKLNDQLLDVYKNAGQPSRPTEGPKYKSNYGYSTRDNAALRSELAAQQRGMDVNEAYTEGYGGIGGGLPGQTWRERARPEGFGQILPLPRYPGAQPNTKDLLEYMSTVSANIGLKRQGKVDARNEAQYQKILAATDGDPTKLTQDQFDQLADLSGDSRFGKVSDFFSSMESGYAQSQYVKGIFQKVARPLRNWTNIGYQSGATSGPSGPFGFRLPWDNGALGTGMSQEFTKLKFMLDNNLSPGQSSEIFNQLMTRGWFGGAQTNDMRKAAAQMFNQGYGAVAQQPGYFDAMDKATRQGAASLTHFNDVMQSVPDAMKAAHLGIQQVMADADALGQYNKTIGGTYIGGLQKAVEWNQITGQPSAILGQLLQNPLVQGQMFTKTGLMPWEQGLASSGQTMGGVMGALSLLNRTILTPQGRTQQIGSTGFSNTISGQQQKEALMAHFLGVAPEVVHTMLSQQHQYQARAQLTDEANAYAQEVRNAIRSGDMSQAALILGGAGKNSWGQLKSDLATAGLSKSQIKQIQDVGKDLGAHWGYRAIGRGKPGRVRSWIPGGTGLDAAQIAEKRATMIKNDIGAMNAKNTTTGPKLTIELGPAAKKAFHLVDPNAQQKAAQNAGSASIDMSTWAGGPTAAPFPDLSTAGGATYNYGSPYDTGSY